MNARRAIQGARRATFALAFLGGVYLYLRVELMVLPASGCSPLFGIDPGARLLLDRRPGALGPGDAVLFRGPTGRLHLARVAEPPQPRSLPAAAGEPSSLWLVVEREDCPGLDSRTLGPIPRADVVAEVVAVLPGGDSAP